MAMMDGIKKFALDRAYDYIEHDPEKNVMKLMEMVDKFAGDGPNSFPKQRAVFREFLSNKDSNWYQLTMRVLKGIDPGLVKNFLSNFILNANIIGWKRQEEIRQKYNCNAPWAILLDPTSAYPGKRAGNLLLHLYRRRASREKEGYYPPVRKAFRLHLPLLYERNADR